MQRLSIFLLLTTLFTAAIGHSAELKKLKAGYLPTSGHLLYFVAKEKGFFQQEGLDVELARFTNSGEGLSAVKAGKLDVGSFGTSAPLAFIAKGADFTIFGGQMGEGHGLIAKPEKVERFKELKNYKGATIGAVRLAFWPIFINTVQGVFNILKGLLDSARVLNLKERTLLWRVVLPGAMPSICTGSTLALVFSFVLLAAAELIGANSGIGWYVKNFADFADYQRVIVGIIFIGIVVTAITWGTERVEQRLLRWRN